jgi:predicted metal-dependent hydrolase
MLDEMDRLQFLNQEVLVVRKAPRRFVRRRLRSYRLTVSMHPDQPLKVVADLKTTPEQILLFLESKKKWIQKNLEKIQQIQAAYRKPQVKEGELFAFLGEMKYLKFSTSTLKKIFFKIEDGFLICYLPRHTTPEDFELTELERRLQDFFKEKAVDYLIERVELWQKKTGLVARELKFRRPKTRWGSCSSAGKVTLNWKLICQPASLIDYVIVHELCHLQIMNHSASFWNLVESFLPEYKTFEEALQQQERLGVFLA